MAKRSKTFFVTYLLTSRLIQCIEEFVKPLPYEVAGSKDSFSTATRGFMFSSPELQGIGDEEALFDFKKRRSL